MKRKVNTRFSLLLILVVIHITSILPVFGLSLGVTLTGVGVANNYISDTLEKKADNLEHNLWLQLQSLKSDLLNISKSEDVDRIRWGEGSHLSKYEYLYSVHHVSRFLHYLTVFHPLVDSAIVCFPGIQKTVDSNLREITPEETAVLEQMSSSGFGIMLHPQTGLYVYNSALRTYRGNMSGTAEIVYLGNSLFQTLSQLSADDETVLMLYNGTVISDISEEHKDVLQHFELNGENVPYKNRKLIAACRQIDGSPLSIIIIKNKSPFPVRVFLFWQCVLAGATGLAILLYILITHRAIVRPMKDLSVFFAKTESGDFSNEVRRYECLELDKLYQHYCTMNSRLSAFIDQEYRQQVLLEQMKFKFLQMQINPHFLFNTYFVIESLLYTEDYENAAALCGLLGKFLKYIAYDNTPTVTLTEEADFANVYLESRKYSNQKDITQQIQSVPPEFSQLHVPKLILQPLIENAYEHGLKGKRSGTIAISYDAHDDYLFIIVENSGYINEEEVKRLQTMLEKEEQGEGIALLNIHKRIRYCIGSSSGISLEKSSYGGLKVVLTIRRKSDAECSGR